MSVDDVGTRVTFAEVQRKAWRSMRTVPCVRDRRYQRNITYTTGNEGLDLPRTGTAVLAVPSPAVAGRGANRMPSTESGESFTHGITDPDAAVAPRFHLGRLLRGQHRIGDESVLSEHREVVASHPQSLAQEER